MQIQRDMHLTNCQATPTVLAVDMAGRPVEWMHWQDAVRHYILDDIGWSVGETMLTIRGGINRDGLRSTIDLHPVIAIRGADGGRYLDRVPALNNRALFARDRYLCLYCGEQFPARLLTRDHVQPVSRSGTDTWENVVSSCKACNNRKSNRTPDEAGMPLLALPYVPNYAESLILMNRHILTDQMNFLEKNIPKDRRFC